MNVYEYILRMKDYASSELRNIAKIAGVVDKKISGVDDSMNETNETTGIFGKSLDRIGGLLSSAFAVIGFSSFVSSTVEARSEYERFEAVLTNTFQSAEVGEGALNMLTDFASKTPYQLNELTDSFVKLVNRGFAPTQEELTKLGDLASSQGKSFGQLSEAILDAETNEFERLKEFGIKAEKAGNKINFTFKGMTKSVDANASSIRKAMLEYGEMEGVAGSMDAISKTIGGRISNFKDLWWGFLVAVGGESGGVFNSIIDGASSVIAFLTKHLSKISMWFQTLWESIKPVGVALFNFFKSMTGISDADNALSGFGDVMLWVLSGVDIFTTGLTTLIGWLTPFADVLGIVAGVWGLLNLAMSLSPITWIVTGIMLLIGVIGLVTKYTSGWGKSWKHTVAGAKLLWQSYTEYVKANFNTLVQGLMIGINKIKLGWYKFKEAIGIGDSSKNKALIAGINADVERRKESILEGNKKMADSAVKAINEFGQIGITVDSEGMKNDFAELKKKFSGLGQESKGTTAYDDWLKGNKKTGDKKKGSSDSKAGGKKADSIVSGGKRTTTINVTINKLQDDTKIYVTSAEKGVKKLGKMVQEELLRSINSINQMQTG